MISFTFCCHRVLDLHVSTPVALADFLEHFADVDLVNHGVPFVVYVERALEFKMPTL